MNRRGTLAAIAALCTAPRALSQPARARIGYLGAASAAEESTGLDALRAGLRELGYIEGRNIAIEFRWAEGKPDRLPGLAAELVHLKVDLLLASGGPAVQAVMGDRRWRLPRKPCG